MVEWQPLIGVIPPLNEADWQQAFHKYQQFPEYQKINHGMDLEGFKMIFMYEYLHRLLGRFIGVLFYYHCCFSISATESQKAYP
ncbi:MAG: COX15/CtaA family protein [Porticoccaceae bacterium]